MVPALDLHSTKMSPAASPQAPDSDSHQYRWPHTLTTASRAVSRHILHSKVALAPPRSRFGPSGPPSSSSAAAMASSASPPRSPQYPQAHTHIHSHTAHTQAHTLTPQRSRTAFCPRSLGRLQGFLISIGRGGCQSYRIQRTRLTQERGREKLGPYPCTMLIG